MLLCIVCMWLLQKKININYQFKEINSQKKFGKDLLPVLRDTPQ